ncbi:MAG: hypothetical protein KC503_24435 [Myxococcales bacterium]|nr:hypothetical protein [Myxococcales bacterium]
MSQRLKIRVLLPLSYLVAVAITSGSVSLMVLGGCGGDNNTNPPPADGTKPNPDLGYDDGGGGGDSAVKPLDARFVRKSGTTALAPDQSWLAVANRDSGSLTVLLLDATLNVASSGRFTVKLGDKSSEVSSIVAGHDGTYVLATLQYDQKLCRIDISAGATQTAKCVATGSEPTGVVVNADGSRIYVANHVDGSVGVHDASLARVAGLDFSQSTGETSVHPFALLFVQEKGATKGALYVSDFFAEKIAGKQEGDDDSRQGVVYKLASDANDVKDAVKIVLAPLAETGFRIPDDQGDCAADATKTKAGCSKDPKGSGAFPNQLASLTYHDGKIFVTSTCASPRGDVRFNMNVHSCVHVIDVATDKEIPALRLNIQERIKQQAGEKLFCTVPRDFACVEETAFCYVACASSDIVIRLDYKDFSAADKVVAGVQTANNLPTGKFPTGLSIAKNDDKTLGFTINENSRDITIIDLRAQASQGEISAADMPTDAKELAVLEGKDFFYTARGRWSSGRWSACVACHPRGLTDNVTWHFPTGPRQTVSMDGSFSKGNVDADSVGNKHAFANVVAALGAGRKFDQRVFNWTAVRDEVADFELNTRGISGGKGAIVDSSDNPVDLATFGGNNNANNNGSTFALVEALLTQGGRDDWKAITEWAKTIRSPRAKGNLPGDAARGRTLYEKTYSCARCHGGASWTASQRYYEPTLGASAISATLKATFLDTFTKNATADMLAFVMLADPGTTCSTDADCKGVAGACDATSKKCRTVALGNELLFSANRPIDQHACVLRDVGSYEATDSAKGGLELRKNMAAQAQGQTGFNIPSLLGQQLGAPYMHNGQYETLAALLQSDVKHRTLLNKVASMNDKDLADLLAFVLSIDGATPAFTIEPKDQLCQSQ